MRVSSGYSWALICVSESRQALSFRRRHTQHKPSVEIGALSSPQIIHPAGFLIRSASIARRACSIMASGVAVSITGVPGDGASRFFLTTPLYQLGRAFEVHDVSGVEPPRAAWALLAPFHPDVLRVMLHCGVDGMRAHRAINFGCAFWGGSRIGHLRVGHCSVLLHPYRRF